MQVALYGDLLERLQGRVAEHGALMLGSGDPAIPYVTERFRLADVRYYVRRAARRLELFAEDVPVNLLSEPCGYCGKCDWSPACADAWEAAAITDAASWRGEMWYGAQPVTAGCTSESVRRKCSKPPSRSRAVTIPTRIPASRRG
jgi:hypothetical protein